MEQIKNSIGFAMTGSFCMLSECFIQLEALVRAGADITPIMSETTYRTDTRFGSAESFVKRMEALTGKSVIHTIVESEPLGPKNHMDILVIAPCTGNTIAKIANGVNDTAVTMAAKAHIRNERPLVIAVSTNDGLGANAKNIGLLLNMKQVYVVPYHQDDPVKKTKSTISKMELIQPAILAALEGRQLQPVLL